MITPLHYTAIVFDLDGTLIDTWPSLFAAAQAVAPGCAPRPDVLRHALSEGIAPMFERAARHLAPTGPERAALASAMHHDYLTRKLTDAQPYDGVDIALKRLAASGYPLALCTNRDRASTEILLRHLGWQSLFRHTQCLDDGLPAKPDPQPLIATALHVAEHPSQVLFVGDSHIDAACAQAAGMHFAAHLRGYHTHAHDLRPAVVWYRHIDELSQRLAQPLPVMEVNHD